MEWVDNDDNRRLGEVMGFPLLLIARVRYWYNTGTRSDTTVSSTSLVVQMTPRVTVRYAHWSRNHGTCGCDLLFLTQNIIKKEWTSKKAFSFWSRKKGSLDEDTSYLLYG
jgi:hypothetical protein